LGKDVPRKVKTGPVHHAVSNRSGSTRRRDERDGDAVAQSVRKRGEKGFVGDQLGKATKAPRNKGTARTGKNCNCGSGKTAWVNSGGGAKERGKKKKRGQRAHS